MEVKRRLDCTVVILDTVTDLIRLAPKRNYELYIGLANLILTLVKKTVLTGDRKDCNVFGI